MTTPYNKLATFAFAASIFAAPYAFAQKAPEQTPAPATKTQPKAAPTTAGQYKTEAEAKTSCAGDNVVWANLKNKKYHTTESPAYGKTSKGAYMCEKNAGSSGFKAVKGNKKA